MKLELKHLTPYLPYNLSFTTESGNVFKTETKESFEIRIIKGTSPNGNRQYHSLTLGKIRKGEFKPILRPLSDLFKGVGIKELRSLSFNDMLFWGLNGFKGDLTSIDPFIEDLSYIVYAYLLKHHYDVFGLIEKGLAIDKNTLNNDDDEDDEDDVVFQVDDFSDRFNPEE